MPLRPWDSQLQAFAACRTVGYSVSLLDQNNEQQEWTNNYQLNQADLEKMSQDVVPLIKPRVEIEREVIEQAEAETVICEWP